MRKRALMSVACACVAFAGCGARSSDTDADLQPCPPRAWAGGGGEEWAVRGVTCEAVGTFVLHHFEPHPGGTTQTAAGFTCDVQQDEGEYSPLQVTCTAEDDRAFRFVFS
jgi:hypothetical protein